MEKSELAMHEVLQTICNELDQLAAQMTASIPSDEPFNVAHNNWSFPGVSKHDLAREASSLANLIRERGQEELGENDKVIRAFPRRLSYMRGSMPQNMWGNPAAGVPAYLSTLHSLRNTLGTALKSEDELARSLSVSQATKRVRAVEARLNDLEPRSENLDVMIGRIERAHEAADQLPTDLDSLEEARKKIGALLREAEKDRSQVLASRNSADDLDGKLKKSAEEAEAVLARCESAYAAATSQGLAAAFSERSGALATSMWVWVAGLVAALLAEAVFGSSELRNPVELVSAPNPEKPLGLHVALSVISIGAPIWFGWLATKQIGQRFRLSEDYAFKAAVSRAYEGFRREAARVDPDLEARLLASALTRLDEQPLRLVEAASYGSPWHELMSSDVVKDAAKSIPGFSGKVVDLAKDALAAVAPAKGKPAEIVKLQAPAE